MEDSRVKSVSQLLSSFFGDTTLREGEEYISFKRAWISIAGPRLGEHSWPADVRHGVLLVETEHSGWIQLLQMKQERILDEVMKRYPQLGVRTLAFRIASGDRAPAADGRPPVDVARCAGSPGGAVAAGGGPAEEPARQEEVSTAGERDSGGKSSLSGAMAALPDELRAHFENIHGNIGGKRRGPSGD